MHYLHSSVLGAAVAELNSVGLKTKRFVYAGGRKIAEEAGGNFTWSHAEPVTGSRGDSTTAGVFIPKAEFNADGVNVGFYEPETNGFDSPDPIASWGNLGLGSNCSIGNPNCVTCYIQGIEHGCGQVRRLMERGIAAQCPNNDCGPRWNPHRDGLGRGGWETLYLLPSGFSYEPIGSSRQPSGRPPVLRQPGPRAPGAGSGNRDPYGNGKNEGGLPQSLATTIWVPIGGLDRMQMWLEEALKYRDCREAMQKILAQIGADTEFAPSTTDIQDLFNAVRNQTGGGGIFVDVNSERLNDVLPERARGGKRVPGGGGLSSFYYTDPGNWRTRQRWSVVFLKGAYSNSQPRAFKQLPYDYVVNVIHEITHNAPNDSSEAGLTYLEEEMDAAGRTLGSTGFDQYVKEHCIPQRYWIPQK